MTEVNSQPPMAWRYCGNQVKRWREQAGVTREELCKETGYHYEYVKSMENGRRKPTLRLLQIADEMCDAHGLLLSAQDYLKPEPFPARSQEYMQAEAEAIALHFYAPLLVPGLLQTEEYARALIAASCPPLDDETIDARVSARLMRQEAFARRPTTAFGFVMYEAALRTLVGGRDVMQRQLLHLLEVGALRNASIQVLQVDRCSGPALNGSFALLETIDHEQLAYVEAPETSALYSDPAKVSELSQSHGMIRMQALGVEDSARFIKELAEEL
ncbi:helix-turn-helix transcriptional regulator [Streptomyces sp. NPDC086554]|uniref:helix-turn-helix domain-containing protein n=1 Tax=Streptomyces sp. NPDC086554 TaxID=3154864 RepID=UPI00344314E0